MKPKFYILNFILIVLTTYVEVNAVSIDKMNKQNLQLLDTTTVQINPTVKLLFYNLPLEKSRKEIREIILNSGRFVSTDTIFNNYQPSTFFKGITTDKGLIKLNPDSIQFMLFLGNTSLSTVKGAEPEFKDIMLINCKYFYSSEDSVDVEIRRITNMLNPILKDKSSGKSKSPYIEGNLSGNMLINETIFESYKPYYRVGISSISIIPIDNSKRIYVLDLVFGKEDK